MYTTCYNAAQRGCNGRRSDVTSEQESTSDAVMAVRLVVRVVHTSTYYKVTVTVCRAGQKAGERARQASGSIGQISLQSRHCQGPIVIYAPATSHIGDFGREAARRERETVECVCCCCWPTPAARFLTLFPLVPFPSWLFQVFFFCFRVVNGAFFFFFVQGWMGSSSATILKWLPT